MLRSETAAEPVRMQRALKGLRAYQDAVRRPPMPTMPSVAETFGCALRDYGGSGAPVLFIPSLINPPNILDLSQDKSLLRWMAGHGHRVLLLDWGVDAKARQHLSIADHVVHILAPLLAHLPEPPSLVGYCLGGTMAAGLASIAPVRGIATIAAPWHFSAFPEDARTMLASLWTNARPAVDALGVLPMEVLQLAFWNLDPGRTIGKFEGFADFPPESREALDFVTLEDWANDGPPLPAAAARELFEGLFAQDQTGNGTWSVGGSTVDLAAIPCAQFHITSTTDRIVPHATALTSGERLDLAQGHVGMIVGSRARTSLWEPLESWLSSHDSN